MIVQPVDRVACRGLIDYELRKPPRMVRGAVFGFASVLIGAAVGSYLIQVPETVTARGLIRPAQGTVLVDAERAGRVRAVHAREGDVVLQGRLLIELDPGTAQEELRIEQERLFRTQRQSSEISRILESLDRDSDPKDVCLYRERLAAIRSELAVNRAKADAAEREWKSHEGLDSISGTEREKKREESRLARLTLKNALDSHRSALEAERRQAEGQELESRTRRSTLERELERSRITAPCGGRIILGAVREVGAFVQAGHRLFAIEPAGAGWILEGWLPGGRAGRAHEGMEAKVNLAAFPVLDYGSVPAVVHEIAPDSQGGENPGTRRVRIRLLASEVRGRAGRGSVAMGMDAEARIVVRERRLLFHFLGDWAKALNEGF